MVAFDAWDHLRRRVTPMLAVYAPATVVVTVAAGTRCAWYGLTSPLDAEQSPPGPGTGYLILYLRLLTTTAPYLSYCWIVGLLKNGQPNPQISLKWECAPPPPFRGWSWVPAAMLGCYRAPPAGFALRRGVKRYPEPTAHGPEACEPSQPCGSR